MKKQVFTYAADKKFDLRHIRPADAIWANMRNKPTSGGIWTSSLKEDSSAWLDWCHKAGFGKWEKAAILTPKHDVKIYVIDSFESLDKVSWHVKGVNRRSIYFEKLENEGFHGVQATEKAVMELGFFPPEADLLDLNAWDCESTFWFNTDWVQEVEIKKVKNYKIQM